LIGCGKAPQPDQIAKTEPSGSSQPDFLERHSLDDGASGINSGESPPQQLSQATPAPAAIFRSQAANEALERYSAARAAIREIPAPALINSGDPLANHAAITGYINELSQRLNTLKAEQTAVQQNLDPDEKKRFKAFQHQLTEEQEEQ
jgi:hypothetical protein